MRFVLGGCFLFSALSLAACSDPESPLDEPRGRDPGAGAHDGGGGAGSEDDTQDDAEGDGSGFDIGGSSGSGLDAGAPGDDSGPMVLGPLDALAPCVRTRVNTSSPPAGASWRFGGGVGYPDRPPTQGDCVTTVRTRAELVAALASAVAGDVVFIRGDARIDLTGAALCVPGGVTLASDRGQGGSAGALLYVTRTEDLVTLRACGHDVRITGLRMFGHEPTECPVEWSSPQRRDCTGGSATDTNCRDCMPRSRAIRAQSVDRLEVDNCELAGWTYGAIELAVSRNNHIHHNDIHHNQRQGLGYGVVLSGIGNRADAVIEHNRFDYNRHSIAGSGAIDQSYVARHNLVLEHANGHVFDMHGISESGSYAPTHGPIDVAGTNMRIHDNTVLPADQWALVVRGRPTEGAWLYGNCLARARGEAGRQTRYTGRFTLDRSPSGAAANRYSQTPSACLPVRFCTSAGGAGPWRYLAGSSYALGSLGFGDFNGDGRTDVFRTGGGAWWWLSGGTGGWTRLNTSSASLGSLAFGDFDGDGRTDVFQTTGSVWQISRGGAGAWVRLNASSATLRSLAFGDFNGDGRTDVFTTAGGEWRVSYGGSGSWQRLLTSTVPLSELGFGDFDGDGRTDVFRSSGGEWHFSSGGRTGWTRLNRSSAAVRSLRFADVDGDGTDDVLHLSGARWNVSYGGRSSWQALAFRSETAVAFHDFDGDGTADAFRTGCH